jgi:hypothetical protein
MWTSWMARVLASHDEADYAARRARRPAVGEWSVTVLDDPPAQAQPRAEQVADKVETCI